MPIQLQISPRLITNIASLYNDSNRMYMEFIDNSIDSAEEYFDAKTNSYKNFIVFVLFFQYRHHKTANALQLLSLQC